MLRLFREFVGTVFHEGVGRALSNAARRATYESSGGGALDRRRRKLSATIDKLFESKVAYGPFKGLKFSPRATWGIDRAAMILGLYEQEVLGALFNVAGKREVLINVGAADGYYAVGVLISGLFQRSYCFEKSDEGRAAIKDCSTLNGVAQQVEIFGAADEEFLANVPADKLSAAVLLMDIEGDEFECLTERTLQTLRNTIIIVEVHDYDTPRAAYFKWMLEKKFDLTELTTSARDLSGIKELATFSDTDRWLICSEGRPRRMTWYQLLPKTNAANVLGSSR